MSRCLQECISTDRASIHFASTIFPLPILDPSTSRFIKLCYGYGGSIVKGKRFENPTRSQCKKYPSKVALKDTTSNLKHVIVSYDERFCSPINRKIPSQCPTL